MRKITSYPSLEIAWHNSEKNTARTLRTVIHPSPHLELDMATTDDDKNNDNRSPIPRDIERQVLLEAGFRCAIPRCMHPTTEMAHIVPWNESKDNSCDNLIALCPNHHTDYDYSKTIDRKAIRIIKKNLGRVNGRYGDLEKRILRYFGDNPKRSEIKLTASNENEIHLMYVLKDGLIHKAGEELPKGGSFTSGIMIAIYELTPEGREFIRKWYSEDEEIL